MINANAGQQMDDKLLYSNVILISNCFRFSILYIISNQQCLFSQSQEEPKSGKCIPNYIFLRIESENENCRKWKLVPVLGLTTLYVAASATN